MGPVAHARATIASGLAVGKTVLERPGEVVEDGPLDTSNERVENSDDALALKVLGGLRERDFEPQLDLQVGFIVRDSGGPLSEYEAVFHFTHGERPVVSRNNISKNVDRALRGTPTAQANPPMLVDDVQVVKQGKHWFVAGGHRLPQLERLKIGKHLLSLRAQATNSIEPTAFPGDPRLGLAEEGGLVVEDRKLGSVKRAA